MTALSGQTDVVRLLWDRQSVWSQAADELKGGVVRARLGTLGLIVAGAVCGTIAAELGASALGRVCAGVAAVALALAAVTARARSRGPIQRWIRARSAAEAIKGDVYAYLSRTGLFRGDDRTELLLSRFDALAESAEDLAAHTASISPRDRPLPEVADVASYIRVRVRGQIDGYYRPKAKLMVQRIKRLRLIETGLAAVSAALAAIAGVLPVAELTPWIAALTTISAAVTAHLSASRYEYQHMVFTRTADELERLLAWRAIKTSDQAADDELVAACERIIAIQNEAWMVRMEFPSDGATNEHRGEQRSL